MNALEIGRPTDRTRDNEIELRSGRFLDLVHPDPSTITLDDVAYGLAQTCRWGGQCQRYYSVAEHAVLVSCRLRELGFDARVQLVGLHHDDHEAFVCDVPRPLKRLLPTYPAIANNVQAAINESLGLPTDVDPTTIKIADNWALAQEAGELLPSKGDWWTRPGEGWDGKFRDLGLDPDRAFKSWCNWHYYLGGKV